ncbi:3'-5' exonuclease [Acinetobacter sp. WCHAc010052]|uniref:3'-5' exonuclease n=1 Tax=Acinetobacter sp. WCHAc010052 TaxID=2004647 RepID=UPI000B3D1BA6|nr:3'-5' exonuclease [Acinetobacter sp. WCHAc010052]AXY58848.1 3'-5' exonuclease domain-containing protein 2 [Acinetobacter sp. WCHAc010052]
MDHSAPTLPDTATISTYPLFQNLPLERIRVIQTLDQCQQIEAELKAAKILGFDTESRPTFTKGETQTGPHLIQLATETDAWLFQVSPEILQFLQAVLSSNTQLKTGFGLKNDAHLFRKKGIQLNHTVDLSRCFTQLGFKNPLGIKNAIAVLFQQNFPKRKSVSTSNWSRKNLSPQQIEYAAADAYAPVLIFKALQQQGLLPPDIS